MFGKRYDRERLALGFHKCVGDLWGGDDFSDFNVVVEGTTFRCHRFILAACSDFFQALFRCQMKECDENSVRIEGIDKKTFDVVINSVYRGVSGITFDNFLDVWRASDQLQIGLLIDECQFFSQKFISVENCFEVLNLANMLVSGDASYYALKFIAVKFKDLSTKFDMMLLSFAELYTVINSDCFYTPREELVLKTIIDWCMFVDTDFSTVEMGHEFGVSDEWATKELTQNGEICPATGVKSGDSNNDVTDVSVLSTDSYNNVTDVSVLSTDSLIVQQSDTRLPAKLCQDIEPEGSLGETIVDDITDPSTLASRTDFVFPDVKESHVTTAARKRSHSLTGLDDGSESYQGPKCKIRRIDRSFRLIDLLKCCQLHLVNSDYLQQLLESSQMITSCPETRQMLARALVYSSDVGRRHDCWPDQAIRRINSGWKHVMVYGDKDCVRVYDLTTGKRKFLHNLDVRCCHIHLAVFENSLFAVFGIQDKEENIKFSAFRYTKEDGYKSLSFRLEQDARMLPHGANLYYLTRFQSTESELCVYRVGLDAGSDWERCEVFHVEANSLVRFNQYILVFHTTNVVIAECYDTKTKTKKELASNMDGTSAGMTSFKYKEVVFLLQTNGSVWKITEDGDDNEIEFELVTLLWDKYVLVLGHVMFESRLHLFVKEDSENVKFFENRTTSLPRIVRIPLNETTEMVPMVVPTSWLWE